MKKDFGETFKPLAKIIDIILISRFFWAQPGTEIILSLSLLHHKPLITNGGLNTS
jgi:hypothetical protein